MPKLLQRLLGGGLALRAVIRELSGIRQQLTRQTDLLERWSAVSGVLPAQVITATARPEDVADTGLSFLDPVEQAIAQDYIAKNTTDMGRAPSDEEVLSYLADEKTVDLHQRLTQRAKLLDLERLGGSPR